MNESSTDSGDQGAPRYERRDVDSISMILLVLLLLVGLALAQLLTAGCLQLLDRYFSIPRTREALRPAEFPGPRLQISPRADLKEFRARDEARLHGYGWVNRNAGTVRIPIERAMDLLVERGLPKTNELVTAAELQQKRPEQKP